MTITLYDAVPSANSDRVKLVLKEKNLSYQRITLNLRKLEQKSPEFLRLNPYGKVPVLVDGEKILFESCIINEYLDECYPDPPLMPRDPYLRARGRIIVDYMLNFLQSDWTPFRLEMLKQPGDRDSKVIDTKRALLFERLPYVEDALGDKPFFLGTFSLTDIDVWPRFVLTEAYGLLPEPSFPRLSAWLERMKSRLSPGTPIGS